MDAPQMALAVADSTTRQTLHKMLSDMLITVADQMFQNRDIYVDGYRFINCSFINCKLLVLRGTFEFHHCLLRGGERNFNEDALKCIQFYCAWDKRLQVQSAFGPKIHEDGTFSIGKGASIP